MVDQTKPAEQGKPDIIDINDVDQFAHIFGIWHGRMMARLRNLREIPFGTEVTMTEADGKETKVKLKGAGMLGFRAALDTAIAELEATPFVMSLEDAPEAPAEAAPAEAPNAADASGQ